MKISQYQKLSEEFTGFCPQCGVLEGAGFEPDAHEYECPECGEPIAMGLEEAMMEGLLNIEEDG